MYSKVAYYLRTAGTPTSGYVQGVADAKSKEFESREWDISKIISDIYAHESVEWAEAYTDGLMIFIHLNHLWHD